MTAVYVPYVRAARVASYCRQRAREARYDHHRDWWLVRFHAAIDAQR